jgi:hypothetical protein
MRRFAPEEWFRREKIFPKGQKIKLKTGVLQRGTPFLLDRRQLIDRFGKAATIFCPKKCLTNPAKRV